MVNTLSSIKGQNLGNGDPMALMGHLLQSGDLWFVNGYRKTSLQSGKTNPHKLLKSIHGMLSTRRK